MRLVNLHDRDGKGRTRIITLRYEPEKILRIPCITPVIHLKKYYQDKKPSFYDTGVFIHAEWLTNWHWKFSIISLDPGWCYSMLPTTRSITAYGIFWALNCKRPGRLGCRKGIHRDLYGWSWRSQISRMGTYLKDFPMPFIDVNTDFPSISCLGAQKVPVTLLGGQLFCYMVVYRDWRSLSSRNTLFEVIEDQDDYDCAVICLESDHLPRMPKSWTRSHRSATSKCCKMSALL